MAFSENLQYLRTRDNLTQEQLAERLEVSRQSVSKWEGGQSFPEMDTILRLCDMFSVSLDTLLRGDAQAEALSDTAGYDHFMDRFAWKISLSIGAILLGAAAMSLLEGLGVPWMLYGGLFFTIVAAAVTVMVASGIQYDNFRKRHPVIPDFYAVEEREAFHDRFVWYIAGAVGAIILGIALCAMAFYFLPEREPYETFVGAGLLLVVTIAVTVMIWAGMTEEKYKIEKYNRTNQRELYPTEGEKKRDDRIERACGVIMVLAAAAYVTMGLTRDLWSTAWWVFPVGFILCGVVHVAFGPREED